MNYGPYHNRNGYGLFRLSTRYDKSSPLYGKQHFYPGRTLASFVSPATMMAQCDTGDSPQYTNSPYNHCQFGDTLATCRGEIRHNGRYTMSYVDGHAKSVQWKAYTDDLDGGHNFLLMPANKDDILAACYDPDATVDGNFDPGADPDIAALEGTRTCAQTVDEMVKRRVSLNYP